MDAGKNRLQVDEYVQGILSGDRNILSKTITLVESQLTSDNSIAEEVLDRILPHTGESIRIGITGIPGVGKSTFIESLGQVILKNRENLAILTVDPTSQRSKGSILGDKTRMETLSRLKNAYIRPSPSSEHLGGVSIKTREVIHLCEAAGFRTIIVETVGVGQSETYVKGMVDFFLLLMIAGAGDELQGIKKGIIEIADALAINKADGNNLKPSRRMQSELRQLLHLFPQPPSGIKPEIFLCSALNNEGIDEIWEYIISFIETVRGSGFYEENRRRQKVNWLKENINYFLLKDFYNSRYVKENLRSIEKAVAEGSQSAASAARKLTDNFFKS